MSGKELVTTKGKELSTMGLDRQIVVTPEQSALVKSMIFPDSTDDELKLFIYYCQRKGVHPLDKLIHPVKRGQGDKAKTTFQSGIDFMRSEAEETGEYEGQDPAEFEFDDPQKPDWPTKATVKVYRAGKTRPFVGEARWIEFFPGDAMGFQWKKMPTVMLSKCAEAQALRRAFPKKLAGLYVPEEMAQADNPKGVTETKAANRSASVKPAAKPTPAAQQNVHEAEIVDEVPLAEKIDLALDYLTDGSLKAKGDLLIQAAREGKGTGAFLPYSKLHLPETSQTWLQKIYTYLEPLIWDKQAAEAE